MTAQVDSAEPFAFDEEWYLAQNPGVAAAIREGRCKRAIDHYIECGRAEGRLPAPPYGRGFADAHNGSGYLSPAELSVTSLTAPRAVLIGSCNLEAWGIHARKESNVSFITVNNASELPADGPGGIEVASLDFAVVQIPLRGVVPDVHLARAPHELQAHEREFEQACRRLEFSLDRWLVWNERHGLLTFVANFFLPQMNSMGLLFPRYDLRNPEHFVYRLNERLEQLVRKRRNAYVLDIDRVASSIGRRRVQDDCINFTSHNSIHPAPQAVTSRVEYLPPFTEHYKVDPVDEFGRAVWAQVLSMFRVVRQTDPVKLVVVDLDDTLWNGVSGEVAEVSSLMVEGWPLGLVEALLYLKKRGVLLAVVSKNEEARIRQIWPKIFRDRLSLDDFAAVRINWRPKTDNMREILAGINLLPRNVVFVDDHPAERSAMRLAFPQMRILGRHPYFLRRVLLWSSETQVATLTDESSHRTRMVQAQLQRDESKHSMGRDEFLASAAPKVRSFWLRDGSHARFGRAFELLNKTNQFNTTGQRWTAQEIEAFFAAGGTLLAFEVSDAFTSYGLVGIVLVSDNRIVQWVMSCRVLGYDVELAVMALLTAELRKAGVAEIVGSLVETDANFPCRDLFARAGFKQRDADWVLSAADMPVRPSHVSWSAD